MRPSPTTLPFLSILLLGACQATEDVSTPASVFASEAVTADAAAAGPAEERAHMAPRETAEGADPKAQDGAQQQDKTNQKKGARSSKRATPKDLQAQLEEAQEERTEAKRKEHYSAAELEIVELEIAASELGVVESLRSARAKLREAGSAMERFDKVERPLQAREGALKVGEAEERLVVEEENLLGILALYAEETEARSMEEIIRRHRKRVETAKERVAIATQKRAALVDHTLPAKMSEKAEAARSAEAALAKAEASAAQTRRKNELSLEKAADSAVDARRDAKKAAKKVDAARRKLNDRRAGQAPKSKDRKGPQERPGKGSDKGSGKDFDKAPTQGGK